ncbi:MAG: hypothetical protein J5I98_16905 [Phaeodactylibacter sp.]|nr:hypothetical protein [Phaeodactylibacter sp.]
MRKQFEAYMAAVNNHDIEKALRFLSDSFQLQFPDYNTTIDKEGFADILGWDKGVNGKMAFSDLEEEEYSIKGRFTERNDFLQLIGIASLESTMVFWFSKPGRIVKQVYTALPGQPSPQEKMQPAVEWAKEHRPDELQAIYTRGQMRYNQKMGERWVALLREWKAASRS